MPAPPTSFLFLDDDPLVLRALRRTLRKEPFDTYFTESPEEAFDLIAAHNVHIVVSDVFMPTMSGLVFFAELARRFPKVRRVFMSGKTDGASLAVAHATGTVEAILEKPWNNQELIRTLHALDPQSRTRSPRES